MRLLTLRNILVATELDDAALPALVAASDLSSAAGASLHAVSVATSRDHRRGVVPGTPKAQAALGDLLARTGARSNAKTHVFEGDPASAIGSLADRLRADVIVLGPHRERSGDVRALGGTALAVVTNASSPCLVVSGAFRLPLRRVLVPIDLSDTARGALLVGLSWASALRGGARENATQVDVALTALHVRPDTRDADASSRLPAIERELEYIRQVGGTWAGVSIDGHTSASADVARGIVDYVDDNAADLVVMGTRGLGLDPAGRLGSVTASVMRMLAVPALLVPPAVWIAHAQASRSGPSSNSTTE